MSLRSAIIADVFDHCRNPLDVIEHGSGVPTHNARRKGVIYKNVSDAHGYYISLNTSGTWKFLMTTGA